MAEGQTISEPVVAVAPVKAPTPVAERKRPWRGLAETAAWTALFAALIGGWAWWQTGSASLVWPYLQGQRLLFDPLHVVIEDAPGGTVVERAVRVLNLTSSNVTLLGSQPSCGCITLDKFPIEILAGTDRMLTLKIGIPLESGPFAHAVKVFTSTGGSASQVIQLTGVVEQ